MLRTCYSLHDFPGLEAASSPGSIPSRLFAKQCIGVVAPGSAVWALRVGNARGQEKRRSSGLKSLEQFRAGLIQARPKKRSHGSP
jgi:hypothetical protein